MSTSEKTMQEVAESVTGFDEIAITKHFGIDLYRDGEAKPMVVMRAMVFVDLKHSGNYPTDDGAHQYAMEMTVGQVNDYFTTDTDIDPDGDPDSESGKDD